MKFCNICGKEKSISEFRKNKSKKDGLDHLCTLCARERAKRHYIAHRQERIDLNGKLHKLRKQANTEKLLDYLLEHPCVDCGESDPIVLEFDHGGDKVANISGMILGSRSWESLLEEMAKCQVRCANCHRRKTAKDFNYLRYAALVKRL